MPAQHSLHVALTAPMLAYVRQQVAEGRFANASQVVRAALERQAGEAPAAGESARRRDSDLR